VHLPLAVVLILEFAMRLDAAVFDLDRDAVERLGLVAPVLSLLVVFGKLLPYELRDPLLKLGRGRERIRRFDRRDERDQAFGRDEGEHDDRQTPPGEHSVAPTQTIR